jgi:hypothetical protein
MKSTQKRQSPVRIPISFEQFVEGVLQIDAKKLPAAKAKKAAKKRALETSPEKPPDKPPTHSKAKVKQKRKTG